MSNLEKVGKLIESIRADFHDVAQSCFEQEGLFYPQVPQEWRSWIMHQAFMNIYRGVVTGDAIMYRNTLKLLTALRSLVSEGVAFSPKILPFPDFLFQSEVVVGIPSSEASQEKEKTFLKVIDQLDRALAIGLHIQEFCELEGVPNPENMWEWCAVLIRMGCLMLYNTHPFLGEDASEDERMKEAESRVVANLFEIDDAIIVFGGVERLISQGISPSTKIPPFPALTKRT